MLSLQIFKGLLFTKKVLEYMLVACQAQNPILNSSLPRSDYWMSRICIRRYFHLTILIYMNIYVVANFRGKMGEPDTDSKHYKAGWGGLVVNVLLVRICFACNARQVARWSWEI